MWDAIRELSPEVQAALIAALVALLTTVLATPLRYAIDRMALRHKLQTEYEYEQRKQLRQLIGKYHGRVIEAATDLNYRLWNFHSNEREGWLDAGLRYDDPENYYFQSFVYRFLRFCALARQFENEALFVDARIAEKSDLVFVKYLKAMMWSVSDVALFQGLPYNATFARDHFFMDHLRAACDFCYRDKRFGSLTGFQECLSERPPEIDGMLRFFDGLKADEPRLRWDRMVVFDLLLMAFINGFGYEMQRSSVDQFTTVAGLARNVEVLHNLARWLPKLGLDDEKNAWFVKQAIVHAQKSRKEGVAVRA